MFKIVDDQTVIYKGISFVLAGEELVYPRPGRPVLIFVTPINVIQLYENVRKMIKYGVTRLAICLMDDAEETIQIYQEKVMKLMGLFKILNVFEIGVSITFLTEKDLILEDSNGNPRVFNTSDTIDDVILFENNVMMEKRNVNTNDIFPVEELQSAKRVIFENIKHRFASMQYGR